jgi:hypothetical protein
MTKNEAHEFARLFNDWASSDHQIELNNRLAESGGGKEHLFINWLIAKREEIISPQSWRQRTTRR